MRPGHFRMEHGEERTELVDQIGALEREFRLEEGVLVRELTAMIGRRRRFEELRRDHDVRSSSRSKGVSAWRG